MPPGAPHRLERLARLRQLPSAEALAAMLVAEGIERNFPAATQPPFHELIALWRKTGLPDTAIAPRIVALYREAREFAMDSGVSLMDEWHLQMPEAFEDIGCPLPDPARVRASSPLDRYLRGALANCPADSVLALYRPEQPVSAIARMRQKHGESRRSHRERFSCQLDTETAGRLGAFAELHATRFSDGYPEDARSNRRLALMRLISRGIEWEMAQIMQPVCREGLALMLKRGVALDEAERRLTALVAEVRAERGERRPALPQGRGWMPIDGLQALRDLA